MCVCVCVCARARARARVCVFGVVWCVCGGVRAYVRAYFDWVSSVSLDVKIQDPTNSVSLFCLNKSLELARRTCKTDIYFSLFAFVIILCIYLHMCFGKDRL